MATVQPKEDQIALILVQEGMEAMRQRGWTVNRYPLNKGGFLIAFDPPQSHGKST
jgi:hypothetical protein